VAACGTRAAIAQGIACRLITIAPRTSYAAFDQRLRELGYVDGQNLSVDFLNPDKYEAALMAQPRN
jgi:hypothetical protein